MDDRTNEALLDMVDHAREAHAMATDGDVEDALADRTKRLAVERLLEIVGEAAGRVPPRVRKQIDLPWQDIVGLRNRLIHAYHRTDPATLIDVLVDDLPDLIARVEDWMASAGH